MIFRMQNMTNENDYFKPIKIISIVLRLESVAFEFIVGECGVVNDCHILENNEKLKEIWWAIKHARGYF